MVNAEDGYYVEIWYTKRFNTYNIDHANLQFGPFREPMEAHFWAHEFFEVLRDGPRPRYYYEVVHAEKTNPRVKVYEIVEPSKAAEPYNYFTKQHPLPEVLQ